MARNMALLVNGDLPTSVAPGSGREAVVEFLERHLIGPFEGTSEQLTDMPDRRYLLGVLYPQETASDEMLIEEENETGGGGGGRDDIAEDPVALSNSWMPSSVGLSFYLSGTEVVTCEVWGSVYEPLLVGKRTGWKRRSVAEPSTPEHTKLRVIREGGFSPPVPVLGGRGELRAHWRPVGSGSLVTITLVNSQRFAEGEADPSLCIYQVGLRCSTDADDIQEYPTVDALSRDKEDAELRLLHRDARIFAIGHGASADWGAARSSKAKTVSAVWTRYLPSYEVQALTHEGPVERQALSLSRLADERTDAFKLFTDLRLFIDDYQKWIDDLSGEHGDIPSDLNEARDRVLDRLANATSALKRGIAVLEGDPTALKAFRLANLAMLMQMRHTADDVAGTRRRRNAGARIATNYLSLDYKWRPFQLAFMLLCIPSIADPNALDRDDVELLWFATGGGKTEAYLGLAAFQIFLRRLRSKDKGAGTTVITRYTLRLLSVQQFQRATALICAAELIRREHEKVMGKTPISIGLWVGEEQAPNTFAGAQEKLGDMLESEHPENFFQVDLCPWCGTEIVPLEKGEMADYGIRVGNASFAIFCPSDSCVFHDKLPISVVDEDLYNSPPTFLLATVDKWARLAWVEKAVAFFGGSRYEPPSLIIQDEMHLLSGPLGTTVAVYESAIEALLTYNGARPKIIASTATVRNATAQVSGLFGRSVRVFPPPGLSAENSYFARVDDKARGRLFVGIMAQSHTPQTTIIHTAAALLQSIEEVPLTDAERDAYWTLVGYHNSIRELGRTATLARDDIPSRVETIAADQSRMRVLQEQDVVELTGYVRGERLSRILSSLRLRGGTDGSISMLVTTNMLSVGVDIPRLGLMLVNGQPKSTSEYIQATSRVGRSAVPGLIVALYNSTKPRDRSHYESFRPFHSALYRYVEPTSVTPFAVASRLRSLHAALVILMRHGAGLAANDAATAFSAEAPETERAVEALLARVAKIDPDELPATRAHLARLTREWNDKAQDARENNRKLYYRASTRQHHALIKDFGSTGDAWPTLHSMRNVDRQCNVWVMGASA
jgi:hypothetical protein